MRNKPDALLKTFLKIYDFKKAIDKKIFFGITLEGKGFYFLKEKISERILDRGSLITSASTI